MTLALLGPGGRDYNYEACVKHTGGGKMEGAVRIMKDPKP